jgi:ATP-binding cassette subfamily B (MDR/TAP) protein 1
MRDVRSNIERVKEGIGDKLGMCIQGVATFLVGYGIAFVYSWKLTAVMLSVMPLLIAAAAAMAYVRTCAHAYAHYI